MPTTIFHNKKYVDVRLAIGELVLNGFNANMQADHKYTRTVIVTINGESHHVALCLRDGDRWVIKTETVQEFINTHK